MKRKLKLRKNPYKGKLIVFEGTDGAGKTTLISLTKKYLEEKNGIGSVLCGLLALGQCGLVCGVGSGQGITVGSQISQVCVNVHDAARVGADSVSVFGEQLTMGVPADTRDVAVLADAETGEGQIGVDQRGVMAISAGFDGLAVRGLAIQDTVGHVLLIHGLLRVVPAPKGISVTPGEVFAGGELKWMVHVVVA